LQTPIISIESTISKDSTKPDISIPLTNSENNERIPRTKEAVKNKRTKTRNYRIQNWLLALVFIFALSISGLGIGVFIGSYIPFWILFGFSIVYSVERWFSYEEKKHVPYRHYHY